MDFGAGSYNNAMDRDYWEGGAEPKQDHSGHDHGHSHDTGDVQLSTGDFGMSFGLGPVPNVPAVLAKMRAGSKTLELGFMGMGKGGGGGHTAGMYGKKQRQALREAALANRMDFTTHTSVGVFGLAGQDRQGNFSRESKVQSMQEIQRAIEFAGDVGRGGPVVVHTGEFHRPIETSEWNQDGKWKDSFQQFEGEKDRASVRVIDRRSGQVVDQTLQGRPTAKPVWNTYDESNSSFWKDKGKKSSYKDANGQVVRKGDFIDYWGNRIDSKDKVPRFNSDKQEFEVEQVGWNELKKESQRMTREARDFWKRNKHAGDNIWDRSKWKRFQGATQIEDVSVMTEEASTITQLETKAGTARGQAMQYSSDFENEVKVIDKLRKAREIYERIHKETNDEEKWRLKRQAEQYAGGLVSGDDLFPHEIIARELKQRENRLRQSQEASANQYAQATEIEEQMKYVESAETYALRESYDAYARGGIYAIKMNEQLKKKGQLKRDIFLGLENLFPEAYGAHPKEIMRIIKGSRKEMVKILKEENGWAQDKAKKAAEDTIKITFDLGHFNMWRKYWKGDKNKSLEENEKGFDKWALDMTDQMAKEGMIGHVHLDDNYGYQDEHLAPGEGNAPIKGMVNILKKNGFKGDLIVEPGADFTTDLGGFQSVMKTWRLFGADVYGSHGGSRSWGSLTAYNQSVGPAPANFSFRPYAPSEDWSLWSGIPFE